ncbi:MAG: flagellar filament capping protein FliD [Sphingopyxis sp.]
METSISYALGAGAGIDTKAMVTSLAAAVKAPKDTLLANRTTANEAKISTLADLGSSLDSFASALNTLISGGTLSTQPTVSDTSILSAAAVPGARLGNFSAQMEVTQLAKGQTLQSVGLASASTAVGQGTLTMTTASGSFTITVGPTNDSLTGLSQAINAANTGVKASILNDSSGARLVLRGPTGAASGYTIAASPTAGVSLPGLPVAGGLERFAYGPTVTGGMTQAQVAQDAIVFVDNVEAHRATNSFNDLVDGLQIDLKKAAPGTIVSLGIERPTASITQGVNDFVAAYNELLAKITAATGSTASDGTITSGPLRGDLAVNEMRRQLSQLTSTALTTTGTGPHTLSEIGVRTNRDGTLSVNASKLSEVLAQDPDGVEALFNPSQYSSSANVSIRSGLGRVKPGVYQLTDLVAANGATPASGKIDGVSATGVGGNLVAPSGSKAVGLIVNIGAGAPSTATITIESGLGGALQSIRDSLRSSTGVFANVQKRLTSEAKSIATDKEAHERRSAKYYTQLLTTFTAMDVRVNAFRATQSYLQQQVDMWTSGN